MRHRGGGHRGLRVIKRHVAIVLLLVGVSETIAKGDLAVPHSLYASGRAGRQADLLALLALVADMGFACFEGAATVRVDETCHAAAQLGDALYTRRSS